MWPELIEKLLQAGRSERELARQIGCAQPTINRLRTGKIREPSWGLGNALIRLAGDGCQCTAVHDHQEAA